MIADSKCSPNAVDLADTDAQVKTLVEQCLDQRTRCGRSLSALFFEKGMGLSKQFAGMTVPSIFQRHLTTLSESSPKPLGIRLASLHPGFGCGCLP